MPRLINGRYLLPCGAESNGHEQHYEAPKDKRQALKLQRAFLVDELVAEEHAFAEYQLACLDRASLHLRYPNLPNAPADAPELLKQGAKRITKLRDGLEAIDEQLDDTPEEVAERKRQEEIAEKKNNARNLLKDIAAI